MKKRRPKARVKRKKGNLLLLLHRLTERERKAVVFALRRKGYLSQYFNWEIAAATAEPAKLLLMDRDVVIAALRGAAPLYLAAHDAIRQLQRKYRRMR
jgi:hypothetical protein